MSQRRMPIRCFLPIAILMISCFAYLQAFSTVRPTTSSAEEIQGGFELPSPPVGAYVFAFIAAPGFVVSLPFFLSLLAWPYPPDWAAYVSFLPGMIFFWYFAGWQIDRARGTIDNPIPFAFQAFPRVMSVASWMVLALLLLVAALSERSYCGNSETLSVRDQAIVSGIVVFWCIAGIFFTRKKTGALELNRITQAQ